MSTLSEHASALWSRLQSRPTALPTARSIRNENVHPAVPLNDRDLAVDAGYFQVKMNELFLKNDREWLTEYDPMVAVVSEFIYGNNREAVPFVVGPSLLKDTKTSPPEGMIFHDTRVAGLHPYKGGSLTLTLVLCRVRRTDHARQLLNAVEGIAGAVDFAVSLGTYVKLGKVVFNAVDGLLGATDTQALAGVRQEFDPDTSSSLGGKALPLGYHVLIADPNIDPSQLWVIDGRLHIGRARDTAEPFRQADYILYSVVGTRARTDVALLPFTKAWDRVRGEAARSSTEHWESAKANMVALYQDLILSPDLTQTEAGALAQKYVEEMKKIRREIPQFPAGLGELGPSQLDAMRSASVDILKS